jgi:hypothetical protein
VPCFIRICIAKPFFDLQLKLHIGQYSGTLVGVPCCIRICIAKPVFDLQFKLHIGQYFSTLVGVPSHLNNFICRYKPFVAGVKFHKIHDELVWCAQFHYCNNNRVIWDGVEGLQDV